MPSYIQNKRVALLHLSFWCVYLSFFLYQISRWDLQWGRVATIVFITLSFTILISYINYFFLLPEFLEKKNLSQYLLKFLLMFAVLIVARIYLERFMIDGFQHKEGYLYKPRFVVQVITTTLFIVLFVAMLRFAIEWFEFESKKKAVENEKLTAELNFLKAQINPHFLFNTLNNLYYLAYSQSPNTTEVISKLSQMMRYMIYDSNHPKVLLSKEIEYMENYISLERLRLNDEIPVGFELKGNPQGVWITPLIFITFLENAFKHGVSNNYPGAWVKITIHLNGNECLYTVKNSKLPIKKTEADEKSGIGLQNVQRRLELSYPDRYQLEVKDEPEYYGVQLKLTLS